jgi:O-antigen/teichoic acid export membrane protein
VRRSGLTLRGGGSVISGAITALSGQALVWLIGFPTSILIARALGAEGRGEYYLPVLAAMVAVVVFNLSLEVANTVAAGEGKFSFDELSRNASLMALTVGPIAMGAMFGVFLLTRESVFEGVETINFAIAAATVPVSLHLAWLASLFLLAKRITRSQIAFVLGSAVYLLGALALTVADELGVRAVLVLYAASVLAPWLLHAYWSADVGSLRPRLDRRLLREVSGYGLKLHPGNVTFYLLLKFDAFLVSVYLGAEEVGIYTLSVLLADLTVLLTYPLVQASIPFQVERSVRDSAPLAFKAARFNFALAVMLAAAFAATMWLVIPGLYGDEFSDAYAALVLLLPGTCAMAVARPLLVLVSRTYRPLLYVGLMLACFVLNVVLNALLLDEIGINGASVASSAAYAVLAVAVVAWSARVAGLPLRRLIAPQPDDWATVTGMMARMRRSSG